MSGPPKSLGLQSWASNVFFFDKTSNVRASNFIAPFFTVLNGWDHLKSNLKKVLNGTILIRTTLEHSKSQRVPYSSPHGYYISANQMVGFQIPTVLDTEICGYGKHLITRNIITTTNI